MKYLTLVLFSIVAIGCAREPSSETAVEGDRQVIEQLHDRYIKAAVGEDVEAFLDTVTDDFVLMPPNEPGARGKPAVRAWFTASFGAFNLVEIVFPISDLTIDHDWAFRHYTYNWTLLPKAGGDPFIDGGNGLYIYHREGDGSWKISHDIWNSSEPLAGSD